MKIELGRWKIVAISILTLSVISLLTLSYYVYSFARENHSYKETITELNTKIVNQGSKTTTDPDDRKNDSEDDNPNYTQEEIDSLRLCSYEEFKERISQGGIKVNASGLAILDLDKGKCKYDALKYVFTKLTSTKEKLQIKDFSVDQSSDLVRGLFFVYTVSNKNEIRAGKYDFLHEKMIDYMSFPLSWNLRPQYIENEQEGEITSPLDLEPIMIYKLIFVSSGCISYPPGDGGVCLNKAKKYNKIGLYGITREDKVEFINK